MRGAVGWIRTNSGLVYVSALQRRSKGAACPSVNVPTAALLSLHPPHPHSLPTRPAMQRGLRRAVRRRHCAARSVHH